MTRPLRLAFLWHQHQPFYLSEGEFCLPWVRLHGVKDYVDLPLLLLEFPQLKQSFNLVPSLLQQIEQYVDGTAQDAVQRLTLLDAATLSESDKREILAQFFLCNVDRMVLPYPRYRELYAGSRDDESALREFGAAEWRDLQVWYNLAWVGPLMRRRHKLERFFKRGRDFTEADKRQLLDVHARILADIIPTMKQAAGRGQAEISVSPLYHPILPLLADSDCTRVAMPHAPTPRRFQFEEDLHAQVRRGRDMYKATFGHMPRGVWPSEGSVSDATLDAFRQAGFSWAATDEQILRRTLGEQWTETEKYFPQRFRTEHGDMTLFFRDNVLSDAVGFHYARRPADEAADDFMARLDGIREAIVRERGEEALDDAIVPVILDGENCWEYYEDNGLPFLRALYSRIVEHDGLRTVTFSEALNAQRRPGDRRNSIHPGSWINADFDIWIGSKIENLAWNLLNSARSVFQMIRSMLTPEQADEAYTTLLLAEGSDWFWWYGDDHQADNKEKFDELFRAHLRHFYNICELAPPQALAVPLTRTSDSAERLVMRPQHFHLDPDASTRPTEAHPWSGAGRLLINSGPSSAMHQVEDNSDRLLFGTGDARLHFRFDPGVGSKVKQLEVVIDGDVHLHLKPVEEQKFSASVPVRKLAARRIHGDRMYVNLQLLLEDDNGRRTIPAHDSIEINVLTASRA